MANPHFKISSSGILEFGGIRGMLPVNLKVVNATTSTTNDSIKLTGATGTALSTLNPAWVPVRDSSGNIDLYEVTADVTIQLTGAHWGYGGDGAIPNKSLFIHAINDNNASLKWGVGSSVLSNIIDTSSSTTATSVTTQSSLLVNTALTSGTWNTNACFRVNATFNDTGDVWTVQTSAGDLEVGITPFIFPNGDGDAALKSGAKLFLDGGDDSYFVEGSANSIECYAGGKLKILLADITTSIRNDVPSNNALVVRNDNNSFTSQIIEQQCYTAASSAYNFMRCQSDTDGAPDREFTFRGDGTGYSDNGWTTPAADYKEYFESSDGLTIEVGTTVIQEGGLVRPWVQGDTKEPFGVVRPKNNAKLGIVGNAHDHAWKNKYLTDDFGSYIMEDYTVYSWESLEQDGDKVDKNGDPVMKTVSHSVADYKLPSGVTLADIPTDTTTEVLQKKKLNPAYDPTLDYQSYESRPEKVLVGFMGQIPVKKGQHVNPNWEFMYEISGNADMYLVK